MPEQSIPETPDLESTTEKCPKCPDCGSSRPRELIQFWRFGAWFRYGRVSFLAALAFLFIREVVFGREVVEEASPAFFCGLLILWILIVIASAPEIYRYCSDCDNVRSVVRKGAVYVNPPHARLPDDRCH